MGKRLLTFLSLLIPCSALAAPPIVVEDYEKGSSPLKTWVVNMPAPDTTATATITSAHPHNGKQCLDVHYKFTDSASYEYLGVQNPVVSILQSINFTSFYTAITRSVRLPFNFWMPAAKHTNTPGTSRREA